MTPEILEHHVARLRATVEQARREHEAWKLAQGITQPKPEPKPARVRRQDIVRDEVPHLLAFGESAERICERLDMSASAVINALHRVGLSNLAPPFHALKRIEQSHPCADCGEMCNRQADRCFPCAMAHRSEVA